MNGTKKELFHEYRNLYKDKKWKKNTENLVIKGGSCLLILLALLGPSFLYIAAFEHGYTYMGFLGIAIWIVAVLCVLLWINYGNSRVFYREETLEENWNETFHQFLMGKGICTEEERNGLLMWCEAVIENKSPIERLFNQSEKMFSVFAIPAAISLLYKLDSYVKNDSLKKLINVAITIGLTILGLFFCIILPGIINSKKGDFAVINDMRIDLIEYQLYSAGKLGGDATTLKKVEMKYSYSCDESTAENGAQDKHEKEEYSMEKVERQK